MALSFHPDHHPNQTEEAKQMFLLIREAFDTLVNPEKRQIYNTYGVTGVKQIEQLQVSLKYPQTEKVLKEFEKAKRLYEIEQEIAQLKIKGNTTVQTSLSELSDAMTGEVNLPEVTSISMNQTVEVNNLPFIVFLKH